MDKVKFLPNVPYIRTILNLFDYTRRTKRKEFFLDFFLTLVMIGLSLFLTVEVSLWFLFIFLINVYILLPLLSRRIKDTGNTPLWCLLLLIGGLGIFPLFIMCFLKSYTGEKKYTTKGGVISIVIGFVSQIIIIPIFVIIVLLIGVLNSEDYTIEYEQKFKPLENKDSFIFENDYTFYYQDYELDLYDLEYEGNIRSHIVNSDGVYFVTHSYEEYNYDVYIYKVSFDGGDFKLVGFKSYYNTYNILYYHHENIFYFQVRNSYGEIALNAYDIITNTYYNIGYNLTYSAYSSSFDKTNLYSVYDVNDSFVVTRLSDLEQKVVDEDVLKNNEAGKLMIEYDYVVYYSKINDNNIYLIYSLDNSSFMPGNYYLFYEYNFNDNELKFITTFDSIYIDDIYKI